MEALALALETEDAESWTPGNEEALKALALALELVGCTAWALKLSRMLEEIRCSPWRSPSQRVAAKTFMAR